MFGKTEKKIITLESDYHLYFKGLLNLEHCIFFIFFLYMIENLLNVSKVGHFRIYFKFGVVN